MARTGILEVVATATPGIKDILVLGKIKALETSKAAQDQMIETFAKKYGDRFKDSWQQKFRDGFDQGTRVVVRYTPE